MTSPAHLYHSLKTTFHRYAVALSNHLTAWVAARGYSRQTWAAIIAATLIGLISLITLYTIIFPAPIATGDYHPFANYAEFKQFAKDNPLYLASVPANQGFSVQRSVRPDKIAIYTIQLSSPSLKPDMSETYIRNYLAVLDQNRQHAIQWIKDNGQDPDQTSIVWRPDPDYMTSKLLGTSTKPIPQKNTPSPTPTPTSSTTPTPDTKFPGT